MARRDLILTPEEECARLEVKRIIGALASFWECESYFQPAFPGRYRMRWRLAGREYEEERHLNSGEWIDRHYPFTIQWLECLPNQDR